MSQPSETLVVIQFAFATLLPVIMAAILTTIEKRGFLKSVGFWPRQVFCGIVFGLIAIYGTEMGIETRGATMNVRDAAPLVAGLYFGGPAGIIAGLIGGIERWFAVLWGRGMYTRLACSVATAAIGFYAAALRRFMFDDKKPSWPIAFAIGIVAEVLHLLLVFLTNMNDALHAYQVVEVCSGPMITCVALSVCLASIAVSLVSGQDLRVKSKAPDISQKVQAGMLVVVVVGMLATTGFVYAVQASLSTAQARDTLARSLEDTQKDIEAASDNNLLVLAQGAAQVIPSVEEATQEKIDQLVSSLDLAEIHVVDANGIIVASSDAQYLGFDMASGDQAAEFLVLLPGSSEKYVVQSYQPISMNGNVWRKFAGVRIEGGFLQVAYDAQRFVGELTEEVRAAVANRHVGREGMLVVLTSRGSFVGTREDIDFAYYDAERLNSAMGKAKEGEMFELNFHGEPYFGMYSATEGLRVLSLLPTSETFTSRDLSVLVISFMEVLVFGAIFAAIYLLIKRVVVRSIWQVNGRLGQITNGDLTVQVDVRDSSEFASLSDDINDTVAALRDAIAAEAKRIERDLSTAKAIQESALPRTFPPFPEVKAFDIYASMNAAREVGGDFYDFFLIDDHTLGFLIADVSGKGIPASLFMMAAKTELAGYMKSGMPLNDAVRNANWDLCGSNEANMFVTVWAATLDYNTGELTYVNAGHNFPLLRHNGTWTWLNKRCGLFLGTFETAKYRQETIQLDPRDQLVLYTDGVNEAFNPNEEEYGNERLERFLAAHANLSPRMLVDLLREDVRRWANGAEQSDDITIMCLEYGVPPELSGSVSVPLDDEGIAKMKTRLSHDLAGLRCPDEVQKLLEHVLGELCESARTHSCQGVANADHVQIGYVFNADTHTLTVSLTDWGIPFDHTTPGTALTEESLAQLDDIAYVRDTDSNEVAFSKSW